jgi:hypothetical protein
MATTLINDYEVMYSANTFPPRIWLLNAGKFIGQLIFQPNGTVLPPDSLVSGQAQIHYHLDDFQNCAAILRYEKTVYMVFNGAGPGNENGLMTSQLLPGT